jgi:hypothetical protein
MSGFWANAPNLLEMNIPIKEQEQRIVSVMQNFASGKKGASLHVGKTSTKGGRLSILPFIPDVQSLLTWNGPDQKFTLFLSS